MMDDASAAVGGTPSPAAGGGGTLWYCVKCTRLITPPGSTGLVTPEGEHLCAKCAPAPEPEAVAVVPQPPAQRRSSRSVIRLPASPPAVGRTVSSPHVEMVELPPDALVEAAPGPKKLPLPVILAGSFCGIGALLFVVALCVRGKPSDNATVAVNAEQTPKPVPQQTQEAPPAQKRDAAPEPAESVQRETTQPPALPVTPAKTTPSQPAKPEVRTDTAPKPPPKTRPADDGLKIFKDGLQNAAKLGDSEKYSAALDLLNGLKTKYDRAAWWPAQNSEWSAAEKRVQQFLTEYANEAQVAREQVEKSDKLDFLEKTESTWRAKFNALASDKLAAGSAVEVLKAVMKTRAKLLSQQRDKKTAEIAAKLDTVERQLKSRPQNVEPIVKQLDELEAQLLQDVDLVEKLGERFAAARYDASVLKDCELGMYRTKAKSLGAGVEIAYDFSSADELQAWTLDDPQKHGGGDFDEKRKAVLVKTMGGHNWDGKDRRATPVLKLPFYFRPETWMVEAAVELVSDGNKGAKPDFGILVWDGSEYVFRLTVTESPGKGCVVNLGACRPKKDNFWAKPQPHLPGSPKEFFTLRLTCTQGLVTGIVTGKGGGSVTIGREQLLFEPRFVGLFVRTNDGGENATAAFHSVRIVGVPNLETIRQAAANQRVSAVPAARADLLKRAADARVAAAPEKGGPALKACPRGTAEGKVGKAFECNGRDTFVETPHDLALEPAQMTLGAWVYVDEFPRDNDGRRWVANKNIHEQENGHYALITQHDHAGAYLNIGGGPGNCFMLTSASGSLKPKTWHHLALTYDGVEMKLYLDGVVASSRTVNRPRQPRDRSFVIGRRQDGHGAFQGRVDDVRLYNRALSQNELAVYVQYPMIASTDGLIAYWSFDGN